MKLRVLLADDHTLFRTALRMSLDTHPDLAVVAEIADGREVMEGVRLSRADVVCMDISMPGLNGFEATQQLLDAYPGVKVIAISGHTDLFSVAKMFKAGAIAYVTKVDIGRHLPLAIRCVNTNQYYFSPELCINDILDLTAYGLSTPHRYTRELVISSAVWPLQRAVDREQECR